MTRHAAWPAPKSEEVLSIAERITYLRLLRGGLATAVLLAAALAPGIRDVSLASIGAASAAYVSIVFLSGLRSAGHRRARSINGAMLLLDGLYLAWAMYATGGLLSPLRFLIYAHIVGVTLLSSYRAGLKIAAWHSLLVFVSLYAQRADLIAVREKMPSVLPGGTDFPLDASLAVAGLLVVAVVTAWLAAANERDLRGQKVDLEQLSDMTADMEADADQTRIPALLLERACAVFGCPRGAVVLVADGEVTLAASRGVQPLQARMTDELDLLMQRAWETRRAVLARRLDGVRNPLLAALVPKGRNVIVVPMTLGAGERLGLLVLERGGHAGGMRRWIVTMIEQFATHAALVLHNTQLAAEVQVKLEENRALESQLYAHNLALESRVRERTEKLSESLESLRVADAERRKLVSRLVNAEEEERRRIAEDTHDGPVQLLTAASLHLQVVRRRLAAASADGDVLAMLNDAVDAVQGSVEGMRTLIFELRPVSLDFDGLAAALREYLQGMDSELTFELDDRLGEEPPDDVRIILYRIAQEALVNVRKHANATSVKVLLAMQDGGFLVRIDDDGAGFDVSTAFQPQRGHLGLASMRERAELAGGRLEIERRPEGGTSVEFWLPPSVGQNAEPTRPLAARGAA
jgi:signal transduction histidine kinase